VNKTLVTLRAAILIMALGGVLLAATGFSSAYSILGEAIAADQSVAPHTRRVKAHTAAAKNRHRALNRFLSIDLLEPPRDVPAARWDSRFCSRWDDGCTRCERQSASDRPTCSPITEQGAGAACVPKLIACSALLQGPDGMDCASMMWANPLLGPKGEISGYRLGSCDPGRCEREGDWYFKNPEHVKIIESFRALSKGIWKPTDRNSIYCIASYRDLCRLAAMRGLAPCP
jgi:hypothetical protein